MVVIVREEKDGKKIKVYKTGGDKVTPAVKKKALAQDKAIEKMMRNLEKKLKTKKPKTTKKYKSLLELKGKKGLVIELWYEVGKTIRLFVDSLKLRRGDKKYIWAAINDHAKDLSRASGGKARMGRDPDTSYWGYFYRLARYEWKIVKEFDWTQWADILDTTLTSGDERIVLWMVETKKKYFSDGNMQDWFRELRLQVNARLTNYDTEVLNERELAKELDHVLGEFKKSDIFKRCLKKRNAKKRT